MSDTSLTKEKIDFSILDSIRGLASLYVLIAHCRGVLWVGIRHYLDKIPFSTWELKNYLVVGAMSLTRLSTEFVILFFVLSGFSISHSVTRSKSKLDFAKKRFIRLYPPYLVAVVWVLIVYLTIKYLEPSFVNGKYDTPVYARLLNTTELINKPIEILKTLIYIPHKGGIAEPFWSLSYEVIFYCLSFFLLSSKQNYYVISTIIFCVGQLMEVLDIHTSNILIKYLFEYNFYFMIGVYLYFHYKKIKKIFLFKKNFGWLLILSNFFLMLVANTLTGEDNVVSNLLSAFLCVLLMIHLLEHKILIKPLKQIGEYSYTLYITHFPSIFLFLLVYSFISSKWAPFIWNPFLFILAIPFCLLIAYILYVLVEKNTKNILSKLRKK